MAERATHDDATKAAVLAALLTGQSVTEVAKEYKINPATVRSWKSRQRLSGRLDPSPEVRAAVFDALNEGRTMSNVARDFQVDRSTIWRWCIQWRKEELLNGDRQWHQPQGDLDQNERYLYLIQESFCGLVKIGIATNLAARLASMQAGCPQELVLIGYARLKNARAVESQLHERFHGNLVRGEWFDLTQRDIQIVMEYHDCFVAVDFNDDVIGK